MIAPASMDTRVRPGTTSDPAGEIDIQPDVGATEKATDMRLATAVAALAILVLGPAPEAGAAEVTRQVQSAVLGGDYTVTCNDGPIARDYRAETQASVPLTDPYAVRRGEDKGLVALETAGGGERRVGRYTIRHRSIRAIVRVKEADTVLPDRVDLVFTAKGLQLVDTFNVDAGVFTVSHVYRLAYTAAGVDRRRLQGDHSDLPNMLDLGLAAYRLGEHRCAP